VIIPDELLDETYELSKRYLKNRYFPDKAIDLLERTASRAMLAGGEAPTAAVDGQLTLGLDTMLSVLSDVTGIPLEKLDQGEMERYLRIGESDFRTGFRGDVSSFRILVRIAGDWMTHTWSFGLWSPIRRLSLDSRKRRIWTGAIR